ncbi:MAG TPA: amidohydrolase [Blastocatellia bacterium]|jgi:hippurate hydrolase
MMRRKIFAALLWLAALVLPVSAQQSIDQMIDQEIASLVTAYKMLHAAPELSGHEEKTAAFVAKELRALGYAVTEGLGKYATQPWKGHGVVAVMKNGAGPTLLVRADMDALPVEEKTGLDYASKVKTRNTAGQEVSVMHACGHDIHVATLIGAARLLARMKDRWQGTLVLIGQPAEEMGSGAKAMLDDGLYTRFPRPDYAIALHVGSFEAGKVSYVSGYNMASVDSVDITVRGIGGHGSRPEAAKDPVVIAAQVVIALQTIVSRERSPFDPAVVTVGSIHGGTKHNIIPDDVHLQLTVRTYKKDVRDQIIASIERIAKGVAITAGLPEDRMPVVKVSGSGPATYNDPALTERLAQSFRRALGEENVVKGTAVMGSEDFGLLGLDGKIPTSMFRLGGTDPAEVRKSMQSGVALPSNHSPLFAPLPEPTIRTGVKAMTAAVLDLMKKGQARQSPDPSERE